jgi:hypothetical protein
MSEHRRPAPQLRVIGGSRDVTENGVRMPKIESGIPIPSSNPSTAYPFARMRVGDSFQVPLEEARSLRNAVNAFVRRNKARAISAEFHGDPVEVYKFTTRQTDAGMLRVWRIS